MKTRTLSDRAFHPDAPTVGFRNVPRDGKSQSRAANFARAPFVHAIETLEDAFLFRMRNTDSIVGHGEYNFGAVNHCARDDVSTRRRVLHRVIKQVLQHVAQSP